MTSIRALHYETNQPILLTMADQLISCIKPFNCSAAEASGLPFIAPGLFDIQINGYAGLWFCSETLTISEVHRVVRSLAGCGIPRFFPTLITCSFKAMEHGVATIRAACEQDDLTRLVIRGIHLEGPYISPEDGPRGAHPRQHVRSARFDEFEKWQKASGGMVKLVTLAPESEGAIAFIEAAVASGVVISIGHTAATPDQIQNAVLAGATLSTHLGNGCAAMVNRHRNIFWPQMANDQLIASVIADGHHVPADMLKCMTRCKTPDRMILTCDVSGFGGCLPGRYEAGGVAVEILDDGRIVVADQREFLAGSGATTGDCVAHMMSTCNMSLAQAWHLASTRPASLFGESACSLGIGQSATLTLFHMHSDTDVPARFEPVAAYANGNMVVPSS